MATTPQLLPRRALRYRYMAAGAAPIDLELMVPRFTAAPDSFSVTWTTGNPAHWTFSGTTVTGSAAGAAADFGDVTYIATVTATWADYGVATNTLTIVCPPNVVCVDPATGSDANAGTEVSPWAHAPDDPLATGNAAAFTPSGLTLCVIKDGSIIRSGLVPQFDNLWTASGCGWGDGVSETIYSGANVLTGGSTPTQPQVDGNPNYASMQRFTLATARDKHQFLIDPLAADPLMIWAQWPRAGAARYRDSFDPFFNGTRGCWRVDITAFVYAPGGTNSTFTCPPGLEAEWDAEFSTYSVRGRVFGMSSRANFMRWFFIKNHDVVTRTLTIDLPASDFIDPATGQLYLTTGMIGIQVCGSPRSLSSAGQFAWDDGSLVIVAWTEPGSTPEIMTRHIGCDASGVDYGVIQSLTFQGYYGVLNEQQGSAISIGKTTGTWAFEAYDCRARWLSASSTSAGFRAAGLATSDGIVVQSLEVTQSWLTALWRITCDLNIGPEIYDCYSKDLNASAAPLFNGEDIHVYANVILDTSGPHANSMTFYYACRGLVENNYMRGSRPLTAQESGETRAGTLTFQDNTFITDELMNASALYSGSYLLYNNFFGYPTGVVHNNKGALAVQGGSHTFVNNSFDGVTGGATSTYTDNLLTHLLGSEPITSNIAPNSGNVNVELPSSTALLPRVKQTLGVGPHAAGYIFGIAVIPGLTNVTNRNVSAAVFTGWLGPVFADSLIDWTVTNGLMSIANDSSGGGATAYAASGTGATLNGKYVNIQLTTGSAYDTDNFADIDLGNGNLYTWTVRTKQTVGVPLASIGPTNWWRANASLALAGAGGNSQFLTYVFYGLMGSMTTGAWLGHYNSNIRIRFEMLNTNRYRVLLANSAGTSIASFNTPVFTAPQMNTVVKVMVTVDMTQTTAAAGVKMYVDETNAGASSATVWDATGTGVIAWEQATIDTKLGNALTGLLGYVLLHNKLADFSDADVRAQCEPHRIGDNGENLFGEPPLVWCIGDATYWNATSPFNINLGSAPANLIRQSGGATVVLDSGGASAWPNFTYATALVDLLGPDGQVGAEEYYQVTVNDTLAFPITVALSDGGAGGTFTPSSLSFDALVGAQTQIFTYEPVASGAPVLTASSTGLTSASLEIAVAPAPATTYTLSGQATADVNTPIEIQVELDGSNEVGVNISFVVTGVAGAVVPNPVFVPPGDMTITVAAVFTGPGSAIITASNDGDLTDPSPLAVEVQATMDTATAAQLIRLGIR